MSLRLTLPAQDGYAMPAEWEDHAACWMAYPRRSAAYGGRIDDARTAYANLAHAIADFEPVQMVVHPHDHADAKKRLGGGIALYPMDIDDAWLRDSGPTFVKNHAGEVAGVDWQFNAWGRKYEGWADDDRTARNILAQLQLPRYLAPLVLEGGSIHTNGSGTALTTRQCLLHANRNPRLSERDIEQLLCAYLGVQKIIWLDGDARDAETDGHIDNIACFANATTVLLMDCADNPQYQRNRQALESAQTACGKPLTIIPVPQPKVVEDSVDLLASYINFYFVNGGIVMPRFGVPEDDSARDILSQAFPHRKIVAVDALGIVRGGGGIHCVTQQLPA